MAEGLAAAYPRMEGGGVGVLGVYPFDLREGPFDLAEGGEVMVPVRLWEAQRRTGAVVPYWLLAALTAVAPALWLYLRARRSSARRRSRLGLCPTCGYDLRATRGKCPECGEVPGQ